MTQPSVLTKEDKFSVILANATRAAGRLIASVSAVQLNGLQSTAEDKQVNNAIELINTAGGMIAGSVYVLKSLGLKDGDIKELLEINSLLITSEFPEVFKKSEPADTDIDPATTSH